MSDHGLRFSILGPVRAWRDGDEVELGSPQQRLVLAVLLLAEGKAVGHDHLLDAVWADDPPRSALSTLRTYVSRLRAVLGAKTVISIGNGYALVGGVCDLVTMEELSRKGRYREALALWRGEPLAGLEGHYVWSQRAHITERRLAVLERRLTQDVEEGRHTEAIAELTALCGEHPARERLSGLLMLALYRSGRQAEAIGVFIDTRKLLAEDLGIDPSPELAELYQRIITADPALGSKQVVKPIARQVPRQLPADAADFTGREAEIEAMVGELRSGNASALVISALSGAGGMGKTTLAVHMAHRLAPYYPDGQLFVNLQGTSARPLLPETVLGSFLRSLGVDASADSAELSERSALYRSALADRRVLVVLDNAADAAQVRPLLPGSAGCAVLTTSRAQMAGLSGVRQVNLGVMDHDEAMALMAKVAGEPRVAVEREAAGELVSACGNLPLAIRIVASRLAARPAWSVARMRDRMIDERRRLAELRVGDLAVEATFALGYDQLDAAHASAFRLLAIPDTPDFSLAAASAVLDLDEWEAEEACEALVDVSMLESPSPGRYRYHDLLKIFARSRLDDEEERRAVVGRLLDFYLAGITTVFQLTFPGVPVPEPGRTIRSGPCFADKDAAVGWAEEEERGVLSCVHQVAQTPGSALLDAVRLLDMASDVLEIDAAPERYKRTAGVLIEAAEVRRERAAEAHARCLRGEFWIGRRFAEAAIEDGVVARDLSLAEGDLAMYAKSLNLLAMGHHGQRSRTEAIAMYREAIETWRSLGDHWLETKGLGNLSLVLASEGRIDEAVETAELANRITHELGGRMDPDIVYQLAIVLREAGRPEEALSRLLEAREEYRRLKQRVRKGATLQRMAETYLDLKRPDRAVDCAEDSLAIMAKAGEEWVQGKALVSLGQALAQLGQPGRAEACLTEALEIFTRRNLPEADDVRSLLNQGGAPRRGAGPENVDRLALP
ncbi:DNA-binding transcriptional activator of the SARP family [Streptosporangium subroseum]|uniref:DNA-binding transcriptional activator of the SARP family n=1 Tax=Streptosporangium subroseum TaxID=106412 RepID=A0A239ABN0_9ACTN|nr:BTAD domain-containing putative transcriptional regulator [Streptosporangium subroseum]SNR93037.1 DNA-binding transcriptional activator of the SARP family [Streptosporangium subroseum]